jgi:ABC-type multidrug transport system fused ATPase/permease subunit
MCRKKEKVAKEPTKPKEEALNWCMLFKYSTCCEKLIVTIGVIMSILGGALLPSIAVVMGKVVTNYDPGTDRDVMLSEIQKMITWMSVIIGCLWFFSYFQYAFMQHMAERLEFTLKILYLRAIMRQEPAYFEKR